jgi:hypothetical protein
MSAYTAYTAERLAASEFNGQGGKETLLGIAREWKNVSEAEKEVGTECPIDMKSNANQNPALPRNRNQR